MTVALSHKKFTVREFQQMAEAGILDATRLELLDGEIIEMGKIGPRHAAFVRRLLRLLGQQLDDSKALLDVQNPIELSATSQPQPDLSLLIPRTDDYETRHPRPDDVLLLIEVADTTLESDRTIKLPLYSRAGIPEVWLIDLNNCILTAHCQPSVEGYRRVQMYASGDRACPELLPELVVPLATLFPTAES